MSVVCPLACWCDIADKYFYIGVRFYSELHTAGSWLTAYQLLAFMWVSAPWWLNVPVFRRNVLPPLSGWQLSSGRCWSSWKEGHMSVILLGWGEFWPIRAMEMRGEDSACAVPNGSGELQELVLSGQEWEMFRWAGVSGDICIVSVVIGHPNHVTDVWYTLILC